MKWPDTEWQWGGEPPEAQSIRSMLHIVRILAIIFGVILFLVGLAYVAIVWAAWSACGSLGTGAYCGSALGAILIAPIAIVIFGIVDVVIYTQMKHIETMVNERRYEEAKSRTLIWMVLGFLLGGILVGVLLLVAYLKFDPLINWQRSGGGAQPAWSAPAQAAPSAGAPAPAAAERFCPACGAGNAKAAGFCAKCGKPLPPV